MTINRKEQNKIWKILSVSSQNNIQKIFNNSDDIIVKKLLIDIFGFHNLETFDDIKNKDDIKIGDNVIINSPNCNSIHGLVSIIVKKIILSGKTYYKLLNEKIVSKEEILKISPLNQNNKQRKIKL